MGPAFTPPLQGTLLSTALRWREAAFDHRNEPSFTGLQHEEQAPLSLSPFYKRSPASSALLLYHEGYNVILSSLYTLFSIYAMRLDL